MDLTSFFLIVGIIGAIAFISTAIYYHQQNQGTL